MRKLILLFFVFTTIATITIAQTGSVRGFVYDKATGETKDSLKVDHYTGSIEQALKIILRVEKRRIAASEELTLTEDFESTVNKIPFISER